MQSCTGLEGSGGGIYIEVDPGKYVGFLIANNEFVMNSAAYFGGAIGLQNGAQIVYNPLNVSNTFRNNSASYGFNIGSRWKNFTYSGSSGNMTMAQHISFYMTFLDYFNQTVSFVKCYVSFFASTDPEAFLLAKPSSLAMSVVGANSEAATQLVFYRTLDVIPLVNESVNAVVKFSIEELAFISPSYQFNVFFCESGQMLLRDYINVYTCESCSSCMPGESVASVGSYACALCGAGSYSNVTEAQLAATCAIRTTLLINQVQLLVPDVLEMGLQSLQEPHLSQVVCVILGTLDPLRME